MNFAFDFVTFSTLYHHLFRLTHNKNLGYFSTIYIFFRITH